MFDWFKKPDYESDNVYKLPTPKAVPPVPYVEPPSASTQSPTCYRIGKTEDGKITLSLGDYSGTILTMNNAGVDQLIRMLEAAKSPPEDDEPNED